MKQNFSYFINNRGRSLALVVMTALAPALVRATPYATGLTNNGDGSISFRLNQTTGTNDLVQVISGGGTVTNTLQSPSGDPGNVLARGLITTNIGIGSGAFQVRIKHTGSGVISTNSPSLPFNSPRVSRSIVVPPAPFSAGCTWPTAPREQKETVCSPTARIWPTFWDRARWL